MKKIQDILKFKKKSSTSEEIILSVIQEDYPMVNLYNISLVKGVLYLQKLPSVIRSEILIKKHLYLNIFSKKGIHVRDIL